MVQLWALDSEVVNSHTYTLLSALRAHDARYTDQHALNTKSTEIAMGEE